MEYHNEILNSKSMKLKKISILFILLPLCIFFTACSKENDNAPKQSENIIDFEQGNMNFTEGAGEQTFSFTTNTAWVVSVASTRNRGVPWCTVAPTSGNAGSHTIKVTTTPNETYDDRSVTVTLKAGAEVKSFVVSQKQKDALLLTNDKFEVDQAGGTVTVEVKSNVSYTATIGEECKDWIKESNSTRALSTTTKSYTVAMNEDGKKREGSIIFSDGSLTETVHIYQAGGSIILLSQNDCHVSASGEEITVELRSNCDYEVVMPSVDWIKETMTRGMSSHTLHYTVAPNDSYDGRKTEIIYRDKSDSSIADTLTILQAQKDAIIISEKEVKVGSEGGTVEVKIDACVAFEWLYCKLLKKANPISDLSAVVTGIILAMNVPVGMPIGQLIIGDLVAIIVVKQLFGGIGMNFANPALVGRIVLFISFAGSMNNWVFPDAAVDQLSSATPLAVADTSKLSLLDLFMGVHGGVLGETCALAILLGLIYMVATKTISIAIPASYIGSMFIFYLISTGSLHGALVGILSGGLMFGAVFMATDYVTSPFTLKGKLIYGLCLGIVTFAIRQWGSYAEGVSFALLFMNLWVPFINDWTRQTPYGYVKPAKKAKEGAGK